MYLRPRQHDRRNQSATEWQGDRTVVPDRLEPLSPQRRQQRHKRDRRKYPVDDPSPRQHPVTEIRTGDNATIDAIPNGM
jgi:hypothetical protein